MKKWLKQQYLLPNGTVYQILDYVIYHKLLVILLVSMSLLSYPIYQAVDLSDKKIALEKQQRQLQSKNEQLKISIAKLGFSDSKKVKPIYINKILKKILILESARVKNIQWVLGERKVVNIEFTQNAEHIFNVIKAINKQTQIGFNEINLVKLNKDNLVQCILVLSVIENRKGK